MIRLIGSRALVFIFLRSPRWRRDDSAETGPCRASAGRCYVVDGTKRTRGTNGAAPLRRGLPAALEAAAAATVGRTVRGPENERLPQAPDVATRRRAARRRSRERQRVRHAAQPVAAARYERAQTPVGPLPAAARETAS